MILSLSKRTKARLEAIAKERDEDATVLAENAVAEACLAHFRTRDDDPARFL